MVIDIITGMATGLSILGGIAFLVKRWHEPRFVAGILPAQGEDTSHLFFETGGETAQRIIYRQKAMIQPRKFVRNSDGIVSRPILWQNQGHGHANSFIGNLEFNTDKIEIRDICTEAMKVNAIFGNAADKISSTLKSVVADQRIHDAYARIRPCGTYVQLVAPFPSRAVDISIIEIKAKEPIEINVTIRIQTPQRIFQHKQLHQKLNII